jgi:hypothetical protein
MKPITNLNFLNNNSIICDDDKNFYVVLKVQIYNKSRTCALKLLELNEYFTIIEMEVPIACDENYNFESINDDTFVYKFFETNLNMKQVQEQLVSIIKKLNKVDKQEEVKKPEPDKIPDNGTNN